MKRLLVPLCLLLLLSACTPPLGTDASKLKVAATFYPLAFLAEQIGGPDVTVLQVTPGGVEPHEYEPTPQQLAEVHDAKVFLMNGADMDGWADKILDELKQKGTVTARMTDVIQPMEGGDDDHKEEEHAEGVDPHIWLDPLLMAKEAEVVRDALIAADPARAEEFRARAGTLLDRLSALDANFRRGLRDCVVRDAVVSHNAFRYLAKQYGFETIPIVGLSTEDEPSAKRIAEIADFARDNNIKYIFFETLVSPKLAETVANEIGAQPMVLNPIEGLTPDDLANGKDYVSLMQDNLQNLRTTLECR